MAATTLGRATARRELSKNEGFLKPTSLDAKRVVSIPDRIAAMFTPRELQAAALIADGDTTDRIAKKMGTGTATVRCYMASMKQKLGITRSEALLLALAGIERLVIDVEVVKSEHGNRKPVRRVVLQGEEYIPNPQEIAERCVAIRSEGTRPEDLYQPDPWTPPFVRCHREDNS